MKKGFGFLAFSILACVGFAQDCSTFNLNITPGNYWYLYNFNGELLDQGATPEQSSFCVQNGCFQLNVESLAMNPQPLEVSVSDANGNPIQMQNQGDQFYFVGIFSNNGNDGCLDPSACNYDPTATCYDYSLCDYSCLGCTNPNAFNYNPSATQDNGTCCTSHWATFTASEGNIGVWLYSQTYYMTGGDNLVNNQFCLQDGCYSYAVYPLDSATSPSQFQITLEDGSVWISGNVPSEIIYLNAEIDAVQGCADPNACNYLPNATCNDGSCEYASCQGCTDPNATNFDPNAIYDNGKCCFGDIANINTSVPSTWSIQNSLGYYQYGYTPADSTLCLYPGCYTLNAYPNEFDPFNPDGESTYIIITDSLGNVVSEGMENLFQTGIPYTFIWGVAVPGCTEPSACNYNPLATCNEFAICDYSCQGCTDPTAPNYDADATVDNGTCCSAENWNTVSSNGQVIFYAFNPNTGEGTFNEYPYATGYCMNAADCYQLVLYSFMPDNSEVTVTNAQGEVVLSGNLADFGYLQAFVSGGNEIVGCTDPSACNYDSLATCDVGNCMYYCGGCVDPLAANFNAQALYDDGSCVYSTDLPNMEMMLMEDPANSQFYVLMDLASMGTGGPYGVVSSLNEPTAVMSATGQTMKGPYACGTEVQFTVHDMGNNMQTAMTSPIYTMACGVNVEETPTKKSELQVYPNPAKNNVHLTGIEKGTSVEIYDLTGRVVFRDKATTNKMEISISKWNSGIYLVRAGEKTVRLVKD